MDACVDGYVDGYKLFALGLTAFTFKKLPGNMEDCSISTAVVSSSMPVGNPGM